MKGQEKTNQKDNYPSNHHNVLHDCTLLIVHHGYPPEHEAGSEVYTRNLAEAFAPHIAVALFYRTRQTQSEKIKQFWKNGIQHFRVEEPDEYEFEHLHESHQVDQHFSQVINIVQPQFVYFGHLNHLSLNLIAIAKKIGARIIFTLHDYWLRCARGQLIHRTGRICEPQKQEECQKCIQKKYTKNGLPRSLSECQNLLLHRRRKIGHIFQDVDYFIAPTHFLRQKFIDVGCPLEKILYRDYGFNTQLFANLNYSKHEKRLKSGNITFGYCGTAIPSKGLDVLIRAAQILQKKETTHQMKLEQWKKYMIQIHAAPHAKFQEYYRKLQREMQKLSHIRFLGPYANDAVGQIFEDIDVLIVPSIWYENSPLVIHEAFQARIPVITSNNGGMAELIADGETGLLFEQGSAEDLARQMEYYLTQSEILYEHGRNQPSVHPIETDAKFILQLFEELQNPTDHGPHLGPWRITFDTNPELCNLSCCMCETFSPYSNKHRNPQKLMSSSLIEKVVWNALPFGLTEIIPSTMGEPLLYPDFDDIIKICEQTGVKLNLTTNGSWPKKSVEEWATVLLPICSDIKISWNAVDPDLQEKIMRGSKFHKRVEALRIISQKRDEIYRDVQHYCRLTLQMTFMKQNLQEIPRLIQFAYKHNIDRLKGHHLWVLSDQMRNESLRQNNSTIKAWNKMVDFTQQYNKELAKKYGYKLILANFNSLEYQIRKKSNKNSEIIQISSVREDWDCPFLQREAWVAWEGTLNICCAPDDLRHEFGSWGNVTENDFMTLWTKEALQQFSRRYKSHTICQQCLLRRPTAPAIENDSEELQSVKRIQNGNILAPRKNKLFSQDLKIIF